MYKIFFVIHRYFTFLNYLFTYWRTLCSKILYKSVRNNEYCVSCVCRFFALTKTNTLQSLKMFYYEYVITRIISLRAQIRYFASQICSRCNYQHGYTTSLLWITFMEKITTEIIHKGRIGYEPFFISHIIRDFL